MSSTTLANIAMSTPKKSVAATMSDSSSVPWIHAATITPPSQPIMPATSARPQPRWTPSSRPLSQPTMMAKGTP